MNMEALTLNASARTVTGKKVKSVRKAGLVPVVVYGRGIPSRDLSVDYREFEKLILKAGESTLVDLKIDSDPIVKVLVHEVQRHPLKDTPIHADLRQVRMDEKLETNIAIKFVGEAPAVKAFGATLVKNLTFITVSALPGDLVHEIEVDLAPLKAFEDRISIKDIVAPKGIEFLNLPTDVIIIAAAPISEEELLAMDAAKPTADVTEVKAANEEKSAERAAAKDAEAPAPAAKDAKK